jgi:hypothetical protein
VDDGHDDEVIVSAALEQLQRERIEELHRLDAGGKWDELARLARQWVVADGALLLSLALEAATMLSAVGRSEDAIAVLAEASPIQEWDANPDAIAAWLGALAQALRSAGDNVLAQSIGRQALDLRVAPAQRAPVVALLADIHAQLEPSQPELRDTTLHLIEEVKELEFCEPLQCGEASSAEEESRWIERLAEAEAAIERTYRRELRSAAEATRGVTTAEAIGTVENIAGHLREMRTPDVKEFAPSIAAGQVPDEVKSWWPRGCGGLAYRCDVEELVLSIYCVAPDGDVLAFRHDVTFPSVRALLNISKRGIGGELAFLADRLTEVLLPKPLRDALRSFEGKTLLLSADARLEDIPWEALGHDGLYLGTHFDLTMTPSLLRAAATLRDRPKLAIDPQHFTFVANPTGDLPFAGEEAHAIAAMLRSRGRNAEILGDCTRDDFLDAARGAEWLHYAGHADYLESDPTSSYLRLHDRLVTIRDLARGGVGADSVWILNACESAQASSVNASRARVGFPQVLLLEGACAVIAANWPAGDRASADALARFYDRMLATPIASAMRSVRRALLDEGRPMQEWAQYRVFGHPFVAVAPATQ